MMVYSATGSSKEARVCVLGRLVCLQARCDNVALITITHTVFNLCVRNYPGKALRLPRDTKPNRKAEHSELYRLTERHCLQSSEEF